ncbi:GTP-binding protein HSR1-related protein [Cyanobacterium aponinum PCC 10605]|uniref:GTP-binding protein HSR1-related protein n=2 Tax=Cyanobacterium TaxID=102234 RepID=K9Z0V5_CYAAP|nr:GTP-binding protein HSR1-related protein [Cyanobacterium aponinum PCC 10605]
MPIALLKSIHYFVTMFQLKSWQIFILAFPVIVIISFFFLATGLQIHQWGINWIWGVFILIFVLWRWLLGKWTRVSHSDLDNVILQAQEELNKTSSAKFFPPDNQEVIARLEEVSQEIIKKTRNDEPIWVDPSLFFQRCQELVEAIAQIYHPEVEYPLLNIYIPQAYGLIRNTVDDVDKWMSQLSPALNKITVAQGYQAYQIYRRLEPSARKILQLWNWAQWLINPITAATKLASEPLSNQANQELLVNLNQAVREVALKNLARQSALLYRGDNLPFTNSSNGTDVLPPAKTKTLQAILSQAQQPETVESRPVNILLVGRTGAGKSSLINTLFNAHTAEVDILPSTTEIKAYQWQANGDRLNLFDTPGYEQVNRPEYRQQVLDYAHSADIILLLNPALDPSLEMDRDFLVNLPQDLQQIPIISIMTQVDRLRPVREWQPPYNWQTGDKTKEISIREAWQYRQETIGQFTEKIIPLVTANYGENQRLAWNDDILALTILDAIAPAKQVRLARFFRNLEVKSITAAKIIDKYTFQMATSQGLTALLKSPVLQFISTLSTGSPRLAYLLAEKIPIEQLPVVIGKLQLAYELFNLLNDNNKQNKQFDLLSLWTLIIDMKGLPEDDAWAFGHALVEFWTKNLNFQTLEERYNFYYQQISIK